MNEDYGTSYGQYCANQDALNRQAERQQAYSDHMNSLKWCKVPTCCRKAKSGEYCDQCQAEIDRIAVSQEYDSISPELSEIAERGIAHFKQHFSAQQVIIK